jgi:hypothetical protein
VAGPERVWQTILSQTLWFRIALVARAAVTKEIVFRGFAIERIA